MRLREASRPVLRGPRGGDLRLTANTQPAILTVSLAAHAVLAQAVPEARLVAGHSLGEFSALARAGAVPLRGTPCGPCGERGRLMQEAVPVGQGAMSAVLGLPSELGRAGLPREPRPATAVQPANLNEPSQTVISGHAEAVAKRAKRPWPGRQEGHAAASERPFPQRPDGAGAATAARGPLTDGLQGPGAPVVTNVEASPNADPARIVPLLVAQVTAPVRWTECVRAAAKRWGSTGFVELGPGRVLCGLIKRIDRAR
jgi:[acyl-carrier-protein] S-malonyltransferase